MASSYTTNKLLEKPDSGDYDNTWAHPVNDDWDAIDNAFGGKTSLVVTGVSGTVVLDLSQYRPPNILITGVLTANVTYVIPSGRGGVWTVLNNTSGAFNVVIASGGGGDAVTLAQGARTMIVSDGTNIQSAQTIPTGVNAAGANTQVQFNNNGAFGASPNLTWDGSILDISGNLRASGAITLKGSVSGSVSLKAPSTASNVVFTLPAADGTVNQVLGTNGAGALGWVTIPSFTGTTSNPVTFDASNAGAAAGAAFNGAAALLVSANTLGALAIANFTGANQSLAPNGYQTLPGGLILQWGYVTGGSLTLGVTFPIAFPNAFLAGFCNANRTSFGGGGGSNFIYGQSVTGMTCVMDARAGVGSGFGGWWLALGY